MNIQMELQKKYLCLKYLTVSYTYVMCPPKIPLHMELL